MEHRKHAQTQIEQYRKDLKPENLDGIATITHDFKQNIPIFHRKREVSLIFRKLSARTCLNFSIHTKNKIWIFDFISNCASHTAYFASQAFEYLLNYEPLIKHLKSLNVTKLKFWSDNGSHLKCQFWFYTSLVHALNKLSF